MSRGVTIVVPTRNEAQNIGAFLKSLPSGIPLVVVNASDNDTARLIARQRLFLIRIMRKKQPSPKGAALARKPSLQLWRETSCRWTIVARSMGYSSKRRRTLPIAVHLLRADSAPTTKGDCL